MYKFILFLFLRSLKKKESKLEKKYKSISSEYDLLKAQQEHADWKVEQNAIAEAYDMYEQWLRREPIIIPKPLTTVLECYYPYESKWINESYREFRNKKFEHLKQLYGAYNNGRL